MTRQESNAKYRDKHREAIRARDRARRLEKPRVRNNRPHCCADCGAPCAKPGGRCMKCHRLAHPVTVTPEALRAYQYRWYVANVKRSCTCGRLMAPKAERCWDCHYDQKRAYALTLEEERRARRRIYKRDYNRAVIRAGDEVINANTLSPEARELALLLREARRIIRGGTSAPE